MKWFDDHEDAKHVCKLQLSIHGLNQAYQSWNLHFDDRILELSKIVEKTCICKEVSGSKVAFLDLICGRHI